MNKEQTNGLKNKERSVKQTNGLPNNKQTDKQTFYFLSRGKIEDLISWPLSHSNINSTQQNIALPN
jgi:hypothetical protein